MWRHKQSEKCFLTQRQELARRASNCGWNFLRWLVQENTFKPGVDLRKISKEPAFQREGENELKRYAELLFFRRGRITVQKTAETLDKMLESDETSRCSCALLTSPLEGEVPKEEEEPSWHTGIPNLQIGGIHFAQRDVAHTARGPLRRLKLVVLLQENKEF